MIVPLNQQFSTFWQRQSRSQRLTMFILIIAVVVVVAVFVSVASTPSYAVAFSGLDEADAGQIVQSLAESQIPYKLRDAGTILVPSNQVYEVRLQMAREGLPQSGTVGFEIFNGNTFGMTEFTQRVNYQQALEGELERTIGSLDTVEAVRVHIVSPEKTILSSEQAPTTASIAIKPRSGRSLDSAQVQSITHLVASSVEGLLAENVVIVDTNGNMLAAGNAEGEQGAALAQTDSRRMAEEAAANEVERKAQHLLDSVLGPNRSVVQASVALDWTQRETTSQTYSPTQTAVRSSQKTNETYLTGEGAVGGVPGTASNLPTPVATMAAGGGNSTYTRVDETFNYEVSQTQSREIVTPGQIKRVSLSVMVDGVTDAAQLDTLENAIAAAAGIDNTRGDTLAVETLAFDRTYFEDQAAELEKSGKTDLYILIAQIVGAVIGVAMLLLYISRLLKNLRLASSEAWVPVMRPVGEAAGAAALQRPAAHAGALGAGPAAAHHPPQAEALPIPQPTINPHDEQMQRLMSRVTEESPASVAEIIKLWLNEDEKQRG
jgi:flagellar M-ring protein FliF